MIFGLFGKKNNNSAIVKTQYELLTSAARQPFLYTDLGVPDTVMGRFEMLSAVLILYFRRTRRAQRAGQEIAQAIIDAFFEDIDHSIRELGVGDMSVPKRMKKLAGMFYGRLESYAKALERRDVDELALALARNFHPGVEPAPDMLPLAIYLVACEASLELVDEADIEIGQLRLSAAGV